jgi:hypothetical protein
LHEAFNVTDSRLDSLVQAALGRLTGAVSVALDKAAAQLGVKVNAAKSALERQPLMDAQFDLQRRGTQIAQVFSKALIEGVAKELSLGDAASRELADTDWSSLRLVEDSEVEQTVAASRLARQIEGGCAEPMKRLHGLFGALRQVAADDQACPVRPAVVADALLKGLWRPGDKPHSRDTLLESVQPSLIEQLKEAYASLADDCEAAGVQAAPLVSRPAGLTGSTGPGTLGGGTGAGRASHGGGHTSGGGHGAMGGGRRSAGTMETLGRLFGVDWFDGDDAQDPTAPSMPAMSDSGMLGLMRKLHSLTRLDAPVWSPSMQGSPSVLEPGFRLEPGADTGPSGAPSGTATAARQAPIMVNVIRAHRDELVEATGGAKLDQIVIDIVAALFDQVLADPAVPSQMGRQIGRLQLPVLRVALKDPSFFHSRRHPVRQLINRMASLATSFEVLDQGPGREFIDKVTGLVSEIVEGDFDQIALYEKQLTELEQFVEQQAVREAEESAAIAAVLAGQEADLRVQQRYMQKVQRELSDLDIPEFVKTFLAQIWTQVQVLMVARHGHDSEATARMKLASKNLVLSVQPKGHPALRANFLKQLPQLMKDLNEGLDLIQWAPAARQEFFAQLLPLHAEALKTQPAHELTLRLLEDRLRKVVQIPVPSREEAANDPLPPPSPDAEPLPLINALPAKEALAAGFISEQQAIEVPTGIDIDLSVGDDPELAQIDLELPMDGPAPTTRGASLVDIIQPGGAYRMLLKGQWKKVRLTWVSSSRTFFMFNQGHHPSKQTISLTARVLQQMCEGGRFKAFEQAQLLERATYRARKQLAALNANRKIAA